MNDRKPRWPALVRQAAYWAGGLLGAAGSIGLAAWTYWYVGSQAGQNPDSDTFVWGFFGVVALSWLGWAWVGSSRASQQQGELPGQRTPIIAPQHAPVGVSAELDAGQRIYVDAAGERLAEHPATGDLDPLWVDEVAAVVAAADQCQAAIGALDEGPLRDEARDLYTLRVAPIVAAARRIARIGAQQVALKGRTARQLEARCHAQLQALAAQADHVAATIGGLALAQIEGGPAVGDLTAAVERLDAIVAGTHAVAHAAGR